MKPHHPALRDLGRLGVATVTQLRDRFFDGDDDAVRTVLRVARDGGYVELSTELIRPWSHDGKPLADIHVGEPLPSAGPLAYQVRHRRWSPQVVPTGIVRATAKLTAL